MKVTILYRPNSEHARRIEEFAHDFERQQHGRQVELISLDTRDGVSLASLYDIVQYPAILALRNDGQLLNFWQGEQLPLMNEVAAYAQAEVGPSLVVANHY
jgi:hypothetical protein